MIIGISPSAEEYDEVSRLLDQLLEVTVFDHQHGILPSHVRPGRLAVVSVRATFRPGNVRSSSWSQVFPDLAEPMGQMLDVIEQAVVMQALCLAIQKSPQRRREFAALRYLRPVDQHRDYRHVRAAPQGE